MKRFIVLLLLFWAQFFVYCGGKKEESKASPKQDLSENIVGQWDAYWEMHGEEVKDYAPEQRKMSGTMNFSPNGEVKVTTYGFDGCIFMPDTSSNTMAWKIENQILRFMDKEDIHGIPYTIEQFSDDEVHLSIMENIHLTLKR